MSKYPVSEVVTISWCPTKPVLAIAWADGTLSIWTDASGSGATNDDRDVHSGKAVTVLQWSPDGSRLMSGDSVRALVVCGGCGARLGSHTSP